VGDIDNEETKASMLNNQDSSDEESSGEDNDEEIDVDLEEDQIETV